MSPSFYMVLLLIAVGSVVTKDCGGGYSYFSGSCYKVIKMEKMWFDALDYCVGQRGYLATITNMEEAQFVRTLRSGGSKWIGGIESEENKWEWMEGHEPFSWTNWWRSEPNDASKANCLVLKACWIRWADGNCEDKRQFICERPFAE